MRYVFPWGEEAFFTMARFGFIALIIVLQIPAIGYALGQATTISVERMLGMIGF